MASLHLKSKLDRAKEFRDHMQKKSKAVQRIQRAYRYNAHRKGCIQLSLTALRVMRRKVLHAFRFLLVFTAGAWSGGYLIVKNSTRQALAQR